MKDGLYKNFVSKENYLKKQKERNKKESTLVLVIFIINIIMSFRFFKVFEDRKARNESVSANIKIDYAKNESLLKWIDVLNNNIKEATINNGKGSVVVKIEDVNEMLKYLKVEDIQMNSESGEARLKVVEVKDGR